MTDTVLVELRRPWFGPDGIRYRDKVNGVTFRHSIPQELAVQAPSDAKIYSPDGKFLGERKDWSQEAEASATRTKDLRAAAAAARKKATDAAASVQAAKAHHTKQTDAAKKAEAAEAVKAAEAAHEEAKAELEAATAALTEAAKAKE